MFLSTKRWFTRFQVSDIHFHQPPAQRIFTVDYVLNKLQYEFKV